MQSNPIPETVARKAIEGGFDITSYLAEGDTQESWLRYDCEHDWQKLALDPMFFQALGKALGWQTTYKTVRGVMRTIGETNYQEQAHRFYDLILTNQPTEEFWADLLK